MSVFLKISVLCVYVFYVLSGLLVYININIYKYKHKYKLK